MRRFMISAVLVSAVCTASCAWPVRDPYVQEPVVRQALESFDAEGIVAHMEVLASDDLEGRGAGAEGYDRAARYVADTFAELDLEPAGTDGYLQQVPLMHARLIEERSRVELFGRGADAGTPLEVGVDCVVQGNFRAGESEISAEVVFVGFGVTIPEAGYDDYADIDVEGKVVAYFSGAPAGLPSNQRAFYSSSVGKRRRAAERGAVGVITIRTPDDRRRASWERTVRQSRLGAMSWVDGAGAPQDRFPGLELDMDLSVPGEEKLFASSPVSFADAVATSKAGRPQAFELDVRIVTRLSSEVKRLESPNVAAMVRGRDLAHEYVVLTAHLDHLGISDPVNGDAINNGAYDNASGVAILMEVARVFREMPEPPRRSLIFLAVTAEEKGLLGSDYFAHNPTVPIDGVVANVNLDMVMMLHPLHDVVAFGAEHSTLVDPVRRAARRMGVKLSPDPLPEEVLFIRSDQYPFVKKGVPSLFLVSGFESGRRSVDGLEQFRDWMTSIYHTPFDDMGQDFDFEAGADFARVNFLVTYLVANDEERPRWNPGDFFGDRFSAR